MVLGYLTATLSITGSRKVAPSHFAERNRYPAAVRLPAISSVNVSKMLNVRQPLFQVRPDLGKLTVTSTTTVMVDARSATPTSSLPISAPS